MRLKTGMRSAVAAALSIWFGFVSGAEARGKAISEEIAERLAGAIRFDEGGFIIDGYPLLPDATTALVVMAEKAYYTVHLTARGVSGHSSMSPRHFGWSQGQCHPGTGTGDDQCSDSAWGHRRGRARARGPG